MIIKGSSGKEAELPINLFLADGTAVLGHVWATGEVLVALAGAGLANATVANVVEKGRGRYALQMTGAETATIGKVYVEVDTAAGTYLPHAAWDDVIDIGAVARDGILNYVLRSGRTVRGLFRRLDSLFFGKTTGFKSGTVTGYQPDNVTVEFTTTQDTNAGNKSSSVVTNSEVP